MHASDADGNEYVALWRFDAVKCQEPDDDAWPWDDESNIVGVQAAGI